MARSPECPKGGLPKSCARQAAETIEPTSGRKDSLRMGRRPQLVGCDQKGHQSKMETMV